MNSAVVLIIMLTFLKFSDTSACNGASVSSAPSTIQRLCDDGDDEVQQKLSFARFQAKVCNNND